MESLIRDERNHAQWLLDQTPRYGDKGEYPGTWPQSLKEHQDHLDTLAPEQSIVTVYLPERNAVRTIQRQLELFKDAQDTQTVAAYEQILGEERRHVVVTSRILRNLLKVPGVREFYSYAIKHGYRKYHYDFLRSR